MLYALFSIAALALLGLDQWVKHYVTVTIPLGQTQAFWPGVVELCTVHNYGAAWSSFSGSRWLLVAVTSVIVLAVLVLLIRRVVRHPLGLAACFLVLAGGVGNIIDRVRLGYVADICIVCGAVLGVIYYLWFYESHDRKERPHGQADTDGSV